MAFTVWSLMRTGRWLFAERHSVTNDQLPRSLLAPAVTVLAVVALGAITVANLAVPGDIAGQGRSVVAMVPTIEGKVPKTESVELRADYNLDSFIPPTMLLALERAGYSALVPADEAFRYGTWRARATSGPRTQLDLKTFGNTGAPPTPTAVLVATGLPLPVPLPLRRQRSPQSWPWCPRLTLHIQQQRWSPPPVRSAAAAVVRSPHAVPYRQASFQAPARFRSDAASPGR